MTKDTSAMGRKKKRVTAAYNLEITLVADPEKAKALDEWTVQAATQSDVCKNDTPAMLKDLKKRRDYVE